MPTSLYVARWNTHRRVERFETLSRHAALVRRASSVCCGNVFKNNDSAAVTQRAFRRHFEIGRNGKVPTRQTILICVTQFRTTPSIVNKKPLGRPRTVRVPENVRRVAHAFQRSPQRSAPVELTWVILSWKSDLKTMLFHAAYRCLASYDLVFN